ncbi:hypothetical protein AVEN_183171-1 [Araneus ventricosus]|uniref:BTB domain-containing protein n=1 Tax=Araneus ventricosus TaxID=182803 RepID=A0A4Y2J0Q6_ARAVE|nr:hypothetical protein AVEN_183171-1 [Araneus ventricosus]
MEAISSIRHNIGFQWNLKVKEILMCSFSTGFGTLVEIQSSTYRLKDIKDLFFSLVLYNFPRPDILVKGNRKWSLQLTYAFAVVKERAFLVGKFKKLEFLDFLQLDRVDSEEVVEFHCMISAQSILISDFAGPQKAMEPMTTEQRHVDYEYILCSKFDEWNSKFDGEIPDFTVDYAEKLIIDKTANRILKILAMEYLMKNLSAQNVSRILKVAVDEGITVLQKQCADFLISKCTVKASLS